jgi:hypothetical protein
MAAQHTSQILREMGVLRNHSDSLCEDGLVAQKRLSGAKAN